ncbi:hypothetical protein [Amantichitinum ursilacus]|uniref:Uncharacterized protein n=1 Tax=Amantichitinum ursilacus TaxID=857265 RepID=A0A0N0GL29_9NEIS|nr:hypothetical protein [Amantichitinum ursilacus]KPC49556.1 hypothetical protein WG78_19570 [Amantichitinum ursilacus]
MSSIALNPAVETGETGGLHRTLTTLEAALDYALVKKESEHTPNPETWQVTFNVLAEAANSHNPADVAAAHAQLTKAIGETLRAEGKQPY